MKNTFPLVTLLLIFTIMPLSGMQEAIKEERGTDFIELDALLEKKS